MKQDIQQTKQKLTSALKKRDKLFPRRDDKNTKTVKDLEQKYVASVSTLPAKVNGSIGRLPSPVFICGKMKSGTTMLVELLDNHPQLAVLPGDSHLYNNYRNPRIEDSDIVKIWTARMINAKGQNPFWLFPQDQDYANFFHSLTTNLRKERGGKRVIRSILSAYLSSNPLFGGRNIKYWVAKTPDNELHLDQIMSDFPSSRIIHVLRDPRENINSLKLLYKYRGWEWDAKGIVQSFAASLTKLAEYKERLSSRCLVIRYEDMISDREKVVHSVADFLKVGWDDGLLYPTINSMSTRANSMHAKVPGKTSKSGRKQVLNLYEKLLIAKYLAPLFNKYGYNLRSIRLPLL